MGLLDKLKKKDEGTQAAPAAKKDGRKVMVIGLDCAPPEHIFDEYKDEIPNIAKLVDNGVFGPLQSITPPITVPAWACMMTSKDPGTLGIYGFRNRKDHTYDGLEFAGEVAHDPHASTTATRAGLDQQRVNNPRENGEAILRGEKPAGDGGGGVLSQPSDSA